MDRQGVYTPAEFPFLKEDLMRYLLLVLAVATVIVGAHKTSSHIDAKNPVRMANMTPIPPR